MNVNELRHTLSTEVMLENNPFGVLHEISSYVNRPESEEVGRELVLRALEKKDFFNGFYEILDSLTRQVGLFPYLDEESLSFRDLLAYEFHRPLEMGEDFVFHRSQAEVYRRLLDGENVIVSAPTSFGKSRVIDAMIASGKYNNIAVVVPTIALIDETRRRLSVYKDRYKIVTQVSQSPDERNIFVFTAERIIAYENLPKIEFFVIDEFYKIGGLKEDESRTIALNQAFYRLYKNGGQFYMLGPNIQHIPQGLEDKFRCFFYSTRFSTVVTEVIPIFDWKDDIERLLSLAEDIEEQTLIYCRSPKRTNEVVRAMVEKDVCGHGNDFSDAAEWISDNFHPDWIFQKALNSGIGMHHGKLPRSLAQYSVRAFNEGKLKFLVCTSTLIEGVNTKAKNVIILDDIIGGQKYDYFTFNNIKGRSGRMFHHFIGKVFVFHQPPQEQLTFVDFPVYTQDQNTPESLLIQIDDEDLTQPSKDRLAEVYDQEILPISIIKRNSGIDPKAQVELAEILGNLAKSQAENLSWFGIPSFGQIYLTFGLLWKHILGNRARSGVYSSKQLAYKTIALIKNQNTRSRVEAELAKGLYQAKTADEAVERVLEFDRNWAGFELPRALMAMSLIQAHIFSTKYGLKGDYSFFAMRLESLFRNPVSTALEEYGLPIQVMDKIERIVKLSDEIDGAIEEIKMLPADQLGLDGFERELFIDTQSHL